MLYGYTDTAKINKSCVSISARGTIGYCHLHKYPFYPIVRLICAIPNENILIADYLKYSLDCINIKGTKTGIPQLTAPMIKRIYIPIPPLEVQEEIVNILDKFERMCNNLTEGLPSEIAARKKQYEYYRDKLLSFDSPCHSERL